MIGTYHKGPSAAEPQRKRNEKNTIHHEGTKDTKGSDNSDNSNSDLRDIPVLLRKYM
jgi:hypothetical protein